MWRDRTKIIGREPNMDRTKCVKEIDKCVTTLKKI